MRVRLGVSVIVLNRKQLVIVGLLATLALVGVLRVVSQPGAATGDDDDEPVRPIEDVLRLRRRADPDRDDADVGAAGGRRGRGDGAVMAMDEARSRRGTSIDAAWKRLIAAQRRAPDWRYNINVTLSDLTSPDRDLPDTRPAICLSLPYYSTSKQLPTVSVIIPFYNEALTMLLRAVHSVLNKSPDKLLDEVRTASLD